MLDIERARLHTHMLMKDLTEFMLGQPNGNHSCAIQAISEIGKRCLTKHFEEGDATPSEREHGLELALIWFKQSLKGREPRWFDNEYAPYLFRQFDVLCANGIAVQQELTKHQDALSHPSPSKRQKNTP